VWLWDGGWLLEGEIVVDFCRIVGILPFFVGNYEKLLANAHNC
jgi:hypothetical protein